MMTEGGQPLDASNKCNTGRGVGYVDGIGGGMSDYGGIGWGCQDGAGYADILRYYHNICGVMRI